MAKSPLSEALDRAEASLKLRQRERRLADAAPDLLAALKAMVAEFDKFSRYGSPLARDANEAMRAARAAIAKAEGVESNRERKGAP